MTNLREAYAATAMASLASDPNREKAVDRVAASGFAEALGVLLWRAKYQLEADAYKGAQKGLAALYRSRHSHETQAIVEAIVDQVMHEYLSDKCRACNGVKEIVEDQLRVTCHVCGGSGLRLYGDIERAQTMQISFDRIKRLSRAIGWLASNVRAMDARVNGVMIAQLERD